MLSAIIPIAPLLAAAAPVTAAHTAAAGAAAGTQAWRPLAAGAAARGVGVVELIVWADAYEHWFVHNTTHCTAVRPVSLVGGSMVLGGFCIKWSFCTALSRSKKMDLRLRQPKQCERVCVKWQTSLGHPISCPFSSPASASPPLQDVSPSTLIFQLRSKCIIQPFEMFLFQPFKMFLFQP